MRIHTKIAMQWDGARYVTVHAEGFEYDGPIALLCGATSAQNNIQQQQSQFSQQLTQQASQVFGSDSKIFNDLVGSFAPIVAAGPNQQGFSAAENANLQSQAITQTGQAYKNAKAAVGEAESAQGGGNTDLTAGANIGRDVNLAEGAANQTANELAQEEEANYATGRQNYDFAAEGIANAGNVFNSATSAANAATNSQEGAANTANQIAQQDNSWVQGVTGALGGIAGAAAGGYFKGLGSGSNNGNGGGSSLPVTYGPVDQANN